jgi:N-acetylglucosamine-6-phosphate deacetylase
LVLVKTLVTTTKMNSGQITARHYATGNPVTLRWEGGLIQSIEPSVQAFENIWVAPALVELQINGFAGIDFQRDKATLEELLRASRALGAAGCTRFLLTLVTDAWPNLMARLRHLRSLRASSPELQRAIVGWHVEGPFLSPEPGYCGAHNPAFMCDPTPQHIEELRASTGDDPLLLTIAPERPGAIEAIAQATAVGIKVSLGHTNASAETLTKAVQQGAVGFTHLGNGFPNDLNRFDNILWRVFETKGLTASLIPDHIHVSPSLFRLVHKVLCPGAIYYTTDAMSAAGAPPGRYSLGALELEVGEDRVVRYPGKPNFAGSALRPIDGIFLAAKMLGCSWREVWDRFSQIPAELMGLPSGLRVGQPADLCILQIAESNQLQALQVIARGSKVTG